MQVDIPRLVVAAPSSGCGKSTVAMGLMAALAEEHTVQGFKVGPDYIDPGYHTVACGGRPSRNLDAWLVPADAVQRSFARAVQGAEVAIIEGVMGLYDGFDGTQESGSTAEIAKLLFAPVILVLDVARMARSAGALALGYRDYDPALNVAAVICNNVASPRHASWTRQAVEAIGLPVLGCMPRSAEIKIPERHLGLHTAGEQPDELRALLQRLTCIMRQEVDLQRIWQIARMARPLTVVLPVPSQVDAQVRLAVARDEAFCFYYDDNLDLLRGAGAEIAFFSPLRDAHLPPGSRGVYLGGGYPELYAAQLAANQTLLRDLRAARDAGLPIYAECGGLMYLTQGITDQEGGTYPLAGLLPGYCRLGQHLTVGYRTVKALRPSLLLRESEEVRGHEFHYSVWDGLPPQPPYAYAWKERTGEGIRHEGWAEGALLASYVHLHFGARPDLASRFVAACREVQESRCCR